MTTPMGTPHPGYPAGPGYPGGTPAPSSTQEIPAVGPQVRTEGNFAADHSREYPRDHGARADHHPGTAAPGRPDVEGSSVGDLIGEVTQDLSTLVRQELELAKAELKIEAKKAGQGAGMFGAAGFAGYLVLLFGSLAAMWGLAYAIGPGWGGLVIAVLWAIVGGVAYVLGRRKFQEVHPKPERTTETLQQVPGALKPH